MTTISRATNQRVFDFFESQQAPALIEFARAIANVESDYTICMARKAARLHDLLELAGCKMPDRPMIFHHVLEQNLERFRGKSVTLVDDTLILGTTLARAKSTLLAAGALDVKMLVFATDQNEREAQIVHPEKSFLSLDHNALLSFCAAEVQALAGLSIPYLSDFPFFNECRFSKVALSGLQSLPFWDTYPLTVDAGAADGVACYSVLPGDNRSGRVREMFGEHIARLVDLCKIRVYVRRNRSQHYYVRIVPIATMLPVTEVDLDRLFDAVLSRIEQSSSVVLKSLRSDLLSAKAKLRFVQYALSLSVGRAYVDDLTELVGLGSQPEFSLKEATRLFGPWLRKDIQVCHDTITQQSDFSATPPKGVGDLRESELPYSVVRVAQAECEAFLDRGPSANGAGAETRTLRTDLENIFLGLHKNHELPARREVRMYGEKIFDVSATEAPHRDRLKFGFTWPSIVSAVLKREGIRNTPVRSARLSVLLDMLIDAGITVPFLCSREGVLFRAYRHGEDVVFANQEFALAYDIAEGFISSSGREAIPKQIFEKLLVSLIKIGVSKRFLQPIHDINGSVGGIVRVGYHLHGAVVNLPTSGSPIADDRDSWLSSHLVNSDVILKKNTEYRLGNRPEAATIRSDASSEAHQLGALIGLLSTAKDDGGKAILDTNSFTIMASCSQPRDCALALIAELKILVSGTTNLSSRISTDPGRSRAQLERFLNQHFYTALNSARMKLKAYRTDQARQTLDRTSQYLSQQPNGKFLQRAWLAYWGPIIEGGESEQIEVFGDWVDKVAEEIRILAEGVFTMELALASVAKRSDQKADKTRFERTCQKILSYLQDEYLPHKSSTLRDRLIGVCESREPIQDCEASYKFGFDRCRKQAYQGSILVQQVSEFSVAYGRTDKRQNFQYCVWYDIIDSTGQKSGLHGDALRDYRRRVRAFKERIVTRFAGLQIDARRANVFLYAWSNTLTAKDDEKNIFLAGARALDFVESSITLALNEARVHGMRLRVVAIETDFAGTKAFKFEADTDVQGESFWEHGSRLHGHLKTLEDHHVRQNSYVWLAGALRKKPERLVKADGWIDNARSDTVETDIENYPVRTHYLGGAVRTVLKPHQDPAPRKTPG